MDTPVTIAIARTGTFTDSRGSRHTFTAHDLDEIAANYGAAQEDSPLVFGHPEDNQPAYGWVKRLFRNGEKLFAQFAQVPATVRDAVRKGHYKYVSMSLHPGGRQLRHVGLLGAVPPAIPGLGPVEMSGNNAELRIQFSASDLEQAPPAQAAGNQGANSMTPEEMQKRIGALEEQIKTLAGQVQTLTAERDKSSSEADAASKKAQEAEAAKTAVQAEFSAFKGEQQKTARATRLEKLVATGKVTPGESKDVLAQAEALAQIPAPMEFSDGQKETPEDRFWRTFEAREPSVLLNRATPPADFSKGTGTAVPVDLSRKI